MYNIDEPPSSKVKGKKQKCTITAVSNSIRKVPKPMRVTYNPSDWKGKCYILCQNKINLKQILSTDIQQLGQGKSANGSKKIPTKMLVVPGNIYLLFVAYFSNVSITL